MHPIIRNRQTGLFIFLGLFLVGMFPGPVYAQSWKKLPAALNTTNKAALAERAISNLALETAFRQAQTAQTIHTAAVAAQLQKVIQMEPPVSIKNFDQEIPQLQIKSATSGRTPQQWLEKLETFVIENGRFPQQRMGFDERELYLGINGVRNRLDPQNPIAQRIAQLRKEYPSARVTKTPQQWLAELNVFIEQNGRFPRTNEGEEERVLYLGIIGATQRLGPRNPISEQVAKLRQQYPPAPFGKSPQEWLEKLEVFIAENGRFPSTVNTPQEKTLYSAVSGVVQRLGKEDPISQRILQLRNEYSIFSLPYKKPEQWLNELEVFIEKNGRFPICKNSVEERQLYSAILVLRRRLKPSGPIAKRIEQLCKEYCVERE